MSSPVPGLPPPIYPIPSFIKQRMRGLTYCLFHRSAAKINDMALNAPRGRLCRIISFQHTTLCDVFHIDLSASLKQTRVDCNRITMSSGHGAVPRAWMRTLSSRLDSLVDRILSVGGSAEWDWLTWESRGQHTKAKQKEERKVRLGHRADRACPSNETKGPFHSFLRDNNLFVQNQLSTRKKRPIKKINYYKKQNITGWGHNSFHSFVHILFMKKGFVAAKTYYFTVCLFLYIIYIMYSIYSI